MKKKKEKVTNSNGVKEGLQRAQQDTNESHWMDGRMSVDVNICKDFLPIFSFFDIVTLIYSFSPFQ